METAGPCQTYSVLSEMLATMLHYFQRDSLCFYVFGGGAKVLGTCPASLTGIVPMSTIIRKDSAKSARNMVSKQPANTLFFDPEMAFSRPRDWSILLSAAACLFFDLQFFFSCNEA